MNRFLGVSSLILFSTLTAFADGPFCIFTPDAQNQRVLHLTVRSNGNDVSVTTNKSLALPFKPRSVALNFVRKHLIATTGGKDDAQVATIDIGDGELQLVETAKLDHPTGYTSVDGNGKYFLTANYRTGTIASYRIKENGAVGAMACSVKTPNTEAHCILTSPDNRFVYIPCVKLNNALFQFGFDEDSGELSPLSPFNARPPAMFGPRHVAYHPTLPIAYFSNEQQLGVSVFKIGPDGQLFSLQHAVTMPRRSPFEQGKRGLHTSDLVTTDDGKRLFVAVRDFVGDKDSVFAFRIEDDGRLSQIARNSVGDIPWKLDLSPDGKLLLVSESGDRRLSVYQVEAEGKLSRVAQWNWKIAARDMVVAPSEQ